MWIKCLVITPELLTGSTVVFPRRRGEVLIGASEKRKEVAVIKSLVGSVCMPSEISNGDGDLMTLNLHPFCWLMIVPHDSLQTLVP